MDSVAVRIACYLVLSIVLATVSRKSLCRIRTHGFYRFFAFEGILFLLLYNYPQWFVDPFSAQQLVSWGLLLLSVLFVVAGLGQLKISGGLQARDGSPANYTFENTEHLVSVGIYRYVRHPMYSSLLLLAWGACFKRFDVATITCSILVTLALFVTALVEERENLHFFGASYLDYVKKTRMFLPFLL